MLLGEKGSLGGEHTSAAPAFCLCPTQWPHVLPAPHRSGQLLLRSDEGPELVLPVLALVAYQLTMTQSMNKYEPATNTGTEASASFFLPLCQHATTNGRSGIAAVSGTR